MALVHVLVQIVSFQDFILAFYGFHMFMGLLARMVNAMGRVLFVDRRVRDVTLYVVYVY